MGRQPLRHIHAIKIDKARSGTVIHVLRHGKSHVETAVPYAIGATEQGIDTVTVHKRRIGTFLMVEPTYDGFLRIDRKSTRLNSSHANISYAVFCLKKKS